MSAIGELIVRRDQPSQVLLAARDAMRQAVAATVMARSSSGQAQIEWLVVASAYDDVAAALTRLAS